MIYPDDREKWHGNGTNFTSKKKEFILIFVTVFEEYVFQAFDVGAFHYLVKPLEDEKLREVLNCGFMRIEPGIKKQDIVTGRTET